MKIIVLGGSPSIGLALMALSAGAGRSIGTALPDLTGWVDASPLVIKPNFLEEPFSGGGRSKGEKKRAARQRRLKGGY